MDNWQLLLNLIEFCLNKLVKPNINSYKNSLHKLKFECIVFSFKPVCLMYVYDVYNNLSLIFNL